MSFAKFGLLPHHMTSGERPRGKGGQFWPLSTPLSASFHSKPIRLPGEECKEAERGQNCKFLTFDSISTSGFYESDAKYLCNNMNLLSLVIGVCINYRIVFVMGTSHKSFSKQSHPFAETTVCVVPSLLMRPWCFCCCLSFSCIFSMLFCSFGYAKYEPI